MKRISLGLTGLLLILWGAHAFADSDEPTLVVKEHQALVTYHGKTVLKVPLVINKPTTENPCTEDSATLVSNCLVVERDLPCKEGQPGTRGADGTADIYTLDGKHHSTKDSIYGPYFGGPSFTHPSGKWGVILNDRRGLEGDVSGFILLKSDGSYLETKFLESLLMNANGHETAGVGGPHETLILNHLQHESDESQKEMSIIIRPNAAYETNP